VEALLLLGQGNFYYRFRARFHPIATIQSPLFKLRRRKNRAYDPAIPRQWHPDVGADQWGSEALVSVASGDFSVRVERDFLGDTADVLAFLVNNTITELAQLMADSDRRAADDRQRLAELVDARTRELQVVASIDELTGVLNRPKIV
jgi:hypothetical protein